MRPLVADDLNLGELVTVVVGGRVTHPRARPEAYRIGHAGQLRVWPSTGGIVLSHRIGDRCVGLQGDHIEPGVSIQHLPGRGAANSPQNLALLTYACVGNRAVVLAGPARGAQGRVTGKHGGVNHLILDFPTRALRLLRNGDPIQIISQGQGLRIPTLPGVTLANLSPGALLRWGVRIGEGSLEVPIAHLLPGSRLGSGLGRNNVWRGDVDVQISGAQRIGGTRASALRFGDLVALTHIDGRYGPVGREGWTTVGVIVHGDSVVSGHGPGVTVLMTAPSSRLRIHRSPSANLAHLFRSRNKLADSPENRLRTSPDLQHTSV